MNTVETQGAVRLLRDASMCLKDTLVGHSSIMNETTNDALTAAFRVMVQLLNGDIKDPVYYLSSLDPGSGKTEAVCSFLKAWKASGFAPRTSGALIALATRQEIKTCIARSGLQPSDFAVLVKKGHELNDLGLPAPEQAPVLFTTHEKIRRECESQSFAETSAFHYHGQPRRLRIWDETFVPATPTTLRKDLLLQPLADLRPSAPTAAASLEAMADSLSADRVGQAIAVPIAALAAHAALKGHLKDSLSERWEALGSLAGTEAVVVSCNSRGLHLAGGTQPIPQDFAPALILDASGRVRETYRTMEAAGHLKRLPAGPMDYSNLRIHHWDRAASRSAMDDPKARQEVLEAVAAAINESAADEPWLVIYPQDRGASSYSFVADLQGLVTNPSRLSWLHWGNHHGTNDYRDIRKVIVIGLWLMPPPYYSALHVASGGPVDLATDKATLDALKAGENQHNLLQAICRASVRKGSEGVCGACEVHLVGKLGKDARQLLVGTFPGATVDRWTPAGHELTGSALRVARELERAFSPPGVQKVPKSALRALLGFRSSEALAKVTRQAGFRSWVTAQGWQVATRAFELAS